MKKYLIIKSKETTKENSIGCMQLVIAIIPISRNLPYNGENVEYGLKKQNITWMKSLNKLIGHYVEVYSYYLGLYFVLKIVFNFKSLKCLSIFFCGLWVSEGQISFLFGPEVPGVKVGPGTNKGRNN